LKDLHGAKPSVDDIFTEYESRGSEPPRLNDMPAWKAIMAFVKHGAECMSDDRKDEIGQEIFAAYQAIEKGRH
jgi:hypothetical protein